jgi:hypothetical protein
MAEVPDAWFCTVMEVVKIWFNDKNSCNYYAVRAVYVASVQCRKLLQ